MSFILDALKKSENERQRQIGPSFADVRVSRRPGEKPWWAVAVAALLVVNLAVLLVVLLRDDDAKPAAAGTEPATVTAPPAQPQPAAVHPGTQAPLPATASRLPRGNDIASARMYGSKSLADEATTYEPASPIHANPTLAAAAAVPEGPPLVRAIEAPTVAPVPSPAPSQPGQVQHEEVLPSLDEVTGRGTSLPEMHVDIHVYSNNRAERFVFINMRKYTEGQTLSEGPALERITTDGVVLNHRGVRFTLPRR